jgi:MscS family membrane protein
MTAMFSGMLDLVLTAAPPDTADGGVGLAVLEEQRERAITSAGQAVAEASLGLRDALPEWLLVPWPLGLERWQWLGLPALGALAFLVSVAMGRLTTAVLRRLAKRTATQTDDAIIERLGGPVRLGWFGLLGEVGLYALALPDGAHGALTRLFRVLLSLGVFWGVSRAITTWSTRYLASERAATHPGSRALVNLFGRVGQFAVVGFALLATLAELGFSVTSVLAGLGIGGIALALGAQKTLENVFGAFAIAVDQPFREGDFVKVEDVLGTVETIGLRSTRIRTMDRTIVSVPNGKLADMRVETFAPRDRFRLHTTLSLTYGTTATQLKAVRDGVEKILRAHPKLWPDSVVVRFGQFADWSLNVDVMCWFLVKDFDEFRAVREEVLLGFLGVVEQAGSSFAFPTSTVHVVKPEAPAAGR